jgi:TrmH family RNA methyltransferase
MLSWNKIKFINSLKIKKTRQETGLFIMEGEKLVAEALRQKNQVIDLLVSNPEWLRHNQHLLHKGIKEIIETPIQAFKKVTSFETPAGVLVVLPMPVHTFGEMDARGRLSLGLDTLQDPGNLGTIIRTADWFGIRQIFCSQGCADCFNPKAVQASMGAVLKVDVKYTELGSLLGRLKGQSGYTVYGSFMEGTSLYNQPVASPGMLIFGNESKGIGSSLASLVDVRLTIPFPADHAYHVESLNVSAAVAVFCSEFFRRGIS